MTDERWPTYEEDEIAAVVETLRSGAVNAWTGQRIRAFEAAFAGWVGRRHGVALANGTLALECALRALGVAADDEVVVTSRSFLASASCVLDAGARPVFADVDPDSQNVTADTLATCLGERTRAIVVVHLNGWPCEMDAIMALASARGIAVIEDCAQAHGARYRGRPVGTFGDLAAYSFCQDKILSTGGEGGMVVSDDAALADAVWSLKDHGKDRAQVGPAGPEYRWLHAGRGSNYRMTEMQAAIGLAQLRKVDGWLARRAAIARSLQDTLQQTALVRCPEPPAHVRSAWYRVYGFVRPECLRAGWSRARILEALRAEGVPAATGACPELYREGVFAGADVRPRPIARQLGQTSIMLPIHHRLADSTVARWCDVLARVCRDAAA